LPRDASPLLAERSDEARLRFLQAALDRQADRGATWATSWLVAGATLSASAYTLAVLEDSPRRRVQFVVGGSAALFWTLSGVTRPLLVVHDASRVRAYIGAIDPRFPSHTCAAVAFAEAVMARGARDQLARRQWQGHIVPLGLALATGAFIGLALDDWETAALGTAFSIALRETKIWTQPVGLVAADRAYTSGSIDVLPPAKKAPLALMPMPLPRGVGLALGFSF
jgi:hypothetical protein